jgi:hypothetical protein
MTNNFNQTFDTLSKLYESVLELDTPYMLRRDGKLISCKDILMHPYIEVLPARAKDKVAAYKFLLNNGALADYQWFLEHSQNDGIKPLLKSLIDQTINTLELDTVLNKLRYETNQEFCRVRTSGKFLGSSTNKEIYFRISSAGGFNWFNLIWQIVYDNKTLLSYVTVCTDEKSLGCDKFYTYRGTELSRLPVEEFLTLPGNPVIEQSIDPNKATTSLTESFELGGRVE